MAKDDRVDDVRELLHEVRWHLTGNPPRSGRIPRPEPPRRTPDGGEEPPAEQDRQPEAEPPAADE
jgi:hypothetical protein